MEDGAKDVGLLLARSSIVYLSREGGRWTSVRATSSARRIFIVLVAVAASAPAGAGAHGGDDLAVPVIDHAFPLAEGVAIEIHYSVGYQFVASNTTDKDLVILAASGEPFLRIGPEGVFGNFRSPTWYNVNAPEGLSDFPPDAKPGADVPPLWTRISQQPDFGWFDHRLHPATRYVDPEVRTSKVVRNLGGDWTVPVRYGDQAGSIKGHFEFQPALGAYRSKLRSPVAPADGLRVQLTPSSSKIGVPGLFVENFSKAPVVILGHAGEPFVRLFGKAEVNRRSPTWAAIEQSRGRVVTDSDAAAEPQWIEVQASSRWAWPELRAAPPRGTPSQKLLNSDGPALVKEWSIPILVGNRHTTIEGITEFLPAAAGVKAALADAEGRTSSGSPARSAAAVAIAVATALVLVGATRHRRRDHAVR